MRRVNYQKGVLLWWNLASLPNATVVEIIIGGRSVWVTNEETRSVSGNAGLGCNPALCRRSGVRVQLYAVVSAVDCQADNQIPCGR